jgi:NAD(P)-dependent dehydrogenase (short-subunit alcohol dehydrogenase family)
MSEQQRVALVTGAAGGIGREMVLGLLGKGLRVAAVDRTAQGLADLVRAAQERQQGGNLMTIEADLARDESIDEIVSKARGRFGAVAILVNNAGVGQATRRPVTPPAASDTSQLSGGAITAGWIISVRS